MPTPTEIKTGIPYCNEGNRHCLCSNCDTKCKKHICENCFNENSKNILLGMSFQKKGWTHFLKNDPKYRDYGVKECDECKGNPNENFASHVKIFLLHWNEP